MMKALSLVVLVSVLTFVGCGGGSDQGGDVSFTDTYVPGHSLAGVSLGDTYAAVTANYGNPTHVVLPAANGDWKGSIFYGNTVMITFIDADKDGQFSATDTVDSISGILDNGQGLFKFAGVGTGSTAAEILAVIANPIPDTDYGTIILYNTENETNLIFIMHNGICEMVIVGLK